MYQRSRRNWSLVIATVWAAMRELLREITFCPQGRQRKWFTRAADSLGFGHEKNSKGFGGPENTQPGPASGHVVRGRIHAGGALSPVPAIPLWPVRLHDDRWHSGASICPRPGAWLCQRGAGRTGDRGCLRASGGRRIKSAGRQAKRIHSLWRDDLHPDWCDRWVVWSICGLDTPIHRNLAQLNADPSPRNASRDGAVVDSVLGENCRLARLDPGRGWGAC